MDPSPSPFSPARRGWMLALLILAYTFNFIDRQIIGVLAVPIKAELHLRDTELGIMGGLSFALFYTALGLPIAWLADRWSRTWIMTVALALWSACTAACGLATNFSQLFLARMGVGVGEAGGVAPAYSLISDYFPKTTRARALAAYAFGIPIGSALGVVFGGLIAQAVNWRMAFLSVGAVGVLLAPLLRLVLKEPPRQAPPTRGAGAGALADLGDLLRKPSFWFISLGAAASSINGYGLMFWLPSFFKRSLHLGLVETSWYFGAILFIGGMIGIWAGGWLGDRLGRKHPAGFVLGPAAAFVISAPAYGAAILQTDPLIAFPLFLAPQALALAWLGPVTAAVQHLVPARSRTLASAAFLFINNLVGIGVGTVAIGALSEAWTVRFGDQALKMSILAGLGFYLVAALLLLFAARNLKRDWVE